MDACTTFPELFEEITAAKSIQICNHDYRLIRNLFHLLARTNMRFRGINSHVAENITFHQIMILLNSYFKWGWSGERTSTLDETPSDKDLAFVVTVKLTDEERKNAEQKFGKMIYVQDAYGVSQNTNCDIVITSYYGEALISSKNFTNKRCEIEIRNTYLEKYKSYSLKTISSAISGILSGQSVYFDEDCKIYQKLITKSHFLHRCSMYWFTFSSIFCIKDLVWLMMQVLVNDFEREVLLR